MKDWFETNIPEDVATRIIKLRIDLGNGNVVERDFRPDLRIDYETIEEDMTTIPQQFAYWAMVYSEAKAEVAKLERIVKKRRAEVTAMILDEAKNDNMPKVSEKVFKDLVDKDSQVIMTEGKLILANRTMGKLFNIVEAMKIKAEALRSLAGFKKQEQRSS